MDTFIMTPGKLSENFKDLESDLVQEAPKYLSVELNLEELRENQAQARDNIGAASAKDVESLLDAMPIINSNIDNLRNDIEEINSTIDDLNASTSRFREKNESNTDNFKSITVLDDIDFNEDGTIKDANNQLVPNLGSVKKIIYTSNKELIERYDNALTEFSAKCAPLEETSNRINSLDNTTSLIKKLYAKLNKSNEFTNTLRYSSNINTFTDSNTLVPKKYVDSEIKKSELSTRSDIIDTLDTRWSNKLKSCVKSSEVWSKADVYPKWEVRDIVEEEVESSIKSAISNYLFELLGKLDELIYQNKSSIKLNGSVPFTAPQKGVPAKAFNELVTLELLDSTSTWKTSGPIETTVGFMEDNSEVPEVMTLLQIMDSIFYGRDVSITIPEDAVINDKIQITVCIHGSLTSVIKATLYLKDKVINTFIPEDFVDGCVTVESEAITEDSDFIFRVEYNNGNNLEETASIKANYPVFIGTFPWFKSGGETSMEYLEERCLDDPNSIFLNLSPKTTSYTHDYNFSDSSGRKLVIAMPYTYPDLVSITTNALTFKVDAFDLDVLPYSIKIGKNETITKNYKLYLYTLLLVKLNSSVTFNFK